MLKGGTPEQENLYQRIKILERILSEDNKDAGRQWDDTGNVDGNLVFRIEKREEFLDQAIKQLEFTM